MFEEKAIKVIDIYGDEYEGVVVDCNRDIGITIIDATNPKHYLSCLIGPSAPNYPYEKESEFYGAIFTIQVQAIAEGVFDYRNISERMRSLTGIQKLFGPADVTASVETCPYAQ